MASPASRPPCTRMVNNVLTPTPFPQVREFDAVGWPYQSAREHFGYVCVDARPGNRAAIIGESSENLLKFADCFESMARQSLITINAWRTAVRAHHLRTRTLSLGQQAAALEPAATRQRPTGYPGKPEGIVRLCRKCSGLADKVKKHA